MPPPLRETLPASEGPASPLNSQTSFVRFRQVQKTYDGGKLVVDNLDLDIRRGEFLTLLGPSGSGKTSTLMMLAGFEPVTSGEIQLDGKAINHLPPAKRGIGMVFQNYALFPHMSVGENIAFPLEVRKMPRGEIAARVAGMIDLMKLDGLVNRRPAQLSGGQQQRVALARALVFEPKLVLLDEPLGALDKQLREHLQYEIKHIHRKLGVTMIYVTHDQSEALTMSDRIAVFAEGRIQQLAAPEKIYHEPATNFVANFIGENNRLRGKVVSAGSSDGLSAVLPDGSVIQAVTGAKLAPGDDVVLWVRPEAVAVDPPPGSSDNELSGLLKETTFTGDHLRLCIQAGGSDSFILKIRGRAVERIDGPGRPIRIGFSKRDCRAILADSA